MEVVKIKYQDIVPEKNQPRSYFDDEKIELLKENIILNGIIDPLKVKFENTAEKEPSLSDFEIETPYPKLTC